MPHLICMRFGQALKRWPDASWMVLAHQLASGPGLFGQNLTQSARTKLDPGWVCTTWYRTSVEERNWVCKWATDSRPVASCQKPWPSDSCTPACFQSRYIWPKPDQAIQFRSGSVLHNMIQNGTKLDVGINQVYTIWPNSRCTLAVTA